MPAAEEKRAPALLHTSNPPACEALSPEGGLRLGARPIDLRTSAQRSPNENLPSPSRVLETQV